PDGERAAARFGGKALGFFRRREPADAHAIPDAATAEVGAHHVGRQAGALQARGEAIRLGLVGRGHRLQRLLRLVVCGLSYGSSRRGVFLIGGRRRGRRRAGGGRRVRGLWLGDRHGQRRLRADLKRGRRRG